MLRSRQVAIEQRLEASEFQSLVAGLRSAGWTAAITASRERFFELAAVPKSRRNIGSANITEIPFGAEVFFSEKSVFVLTTGYGSADRLYTRVAFDLPSRPIVHLAITQASTSVLDDDDLNAFTEAVQRAASMRLDGRRIRHWSFEWSPPKTMGSRIELMLKRLENEGAAPSVVIADLRAELEQGAEALADDAARELLIELAKAGFAREEDILSRRGDRASEVRAALERLKSAGLLTTEHLLQCRQSSARLTRLSSPEQLAESSVGDLVCANCNRNYSAELLNEVYSVSALGRELIGSSKWMTVWVTRRLIDLGVPADAIRWNLEESGEEVDIIFEYLGKLWILELKDREFGAGDAHPFNYRRVRYRADESIVISTVRIAEDAKRVFRDLSDEGRRASSARRLDPANSQPILVEGLAQVESTLAKRLEVAAMFEAKTQLAVASSVAGFDLAEVVARRSAPASA